MRDAGNLRIHLLSLVSGRIIAAFAALSRGTVTHPILFKILVLKFKFTSRSRIGSVAGNEVNDKCGKGEAKEQAEREREREEAATKTGKGRERSETEQNGEGSGASRCVARIAREHNGF